MTHVTLGACTYRRPKGLQALFASLQKFSPASSDKYQIDAGQTVQSIIDNLNILPEEAKLIFIDGVKADLTAQLNGGERVSIFPPVGGG